MAFAIWTALSVLMACIGIFTYRSKKPVYFFANDSAPLNVEDVKGYNHALAKLWFVYAVLLFLCGLPLLSGNKVLTIVTMLGTVFSTLILIGVYVMKIESKYRK